MFQNPLCVSSLSEQHLLMFIGETNPYSQQNLAQSNLTLLVHTILHQNMIVLFPFCWYIFLYFISARSDRRFLKEKANITMVVPSLINTIMLVKLWILLYDAKHVCNYTKPTLLSTRVLTIKSAQLSVACNLISTPPNVSDCPISSGMYWEHFCYQKNQVYDYSST